MRLTLIPEGSLGVAWWRDRERSLGRGKTCRKTGGNRELRKTSNGWNRESSESGQMRLRAGRGQWSRGKFWLYPKVLYQDWKRSVFIPIPNKGNAKECSNYHTMTLISHTSKVMLKILQARLQQYVKWKLPDVQLGLRKCKGTRDQIANVRWIIERAREFQKNIYFWSIDYTKAFDCVDHSNSWRDGNTLPASWKTCMQVKKQQLEPDM